MTRSQRFSSVLKIAKSKKRDAARVAVKARQKLLEYEGKLNELRNFRREYSLAMPGFNESIAASQLQERQKFFRQLDEGISILKNRVEGQKQSTDLDKQAWLEAHKHSDAMDKLMYKIRRIEIDLDEAREANELDDRSQYRRMSN
jgi:flagellar export protein FliJ